MGRLDWRTIRQSPPPPKKRVVVWVPHLGSWETALLLGREFTVLSGPHAGTILNWREVSHYLIVHPPESK